MTSKQFEIGRIVLLVVGMTFLIAGVADATRPHKLVTSPFKIKGAGTLSHLPLPTPDNPTPDPGIHEADGIATQLGRHSSLGAVQLDEFTSATTANFSSAEPVIFTNVQGDQLAFDYAGEVTLIPELDESGNPTGYFDSRWVADFTPVPELSTGMFKRVVGGKFEMIAVSTDLFLLSDTNLPYEWEGKGALSWKHDEDHVDGDDDADQPRIDKR